MERSVTATTHNTQRCYLLELPKELRLQIYEYLIVPQEIHVFSVNRETEAGVTDDVMASTRFFLDEGIEDVYVALLRTCHFIHQEACCMLYQPRVLVLAPTKYRAGMETLNAPKFDVHHLSGLRSVELLHIDLYLYEASDAEGIRHTSILLSHLNSHIQVRRLSLDCHDFIDYHNFTNALGTESPDITATLLRMWGAARFGAAKVNIEVHVGWVDRVTWTKEGEGPWEGKISKERSELPSGWTLRYKDVSGVIKEAFGIPAWRSESCDLSRP